MPMYAYVLVRTQPNKTENCWNRLREIPGIKTAHTTTGRYDAILYVEGKTENDLIDTVVHKIRNVEGVTYTETLWAPKQL